MVTCEPRELGRVFVALGEHVVFGSEERGHVDMADLNEVSLC